MHDQCQRLKTLKKKIKKSKVQEQEKWGNLKYYNRNFRYYNVHTNRKVSILYNLFVCENYGHVFHS